MAMPFLKPLLSFFRKCKLEGELDEELQFHLEMRTRENITAGMTPEEARYAALRALGNVSSLKERTRDTWGFGWLETLLQDLRYGLRMLRKNPGFTVVVLAALALGIGANAAMFSVVNAVLLRPLPFRDPDRLVAIYGIEAAEFAGGRTRFAGWHDWVGKSRTLENLSIYERGGVNVLSGDQPQHLPAAAASEGFFRLLGIGPVRGRTFLTGTSVPARAEAVISYDLWQGYLGGDSKIIGKELELSGKPFTVIGVMPPGFEFPGDSQVWIPAALNQEENLFGEGVMLYSQIARLKSGATLAQARAELEVFLRQMNQGEDTSSTPQVSVTPLHLWLVGDIRPALLVLMGAVALVLLIACADVANLLMARNATRSREIAVRAAIGAARGRLVRQLLTESVLLSLTGGVAGLLLGTAGARLARALIPASQTPVSEIRLDGWVLGFTFAAAMLTGILAGVLPALGSSRVVLSEALKEAAGGSPTCFGMNHQGRLRTLLGAGEVTLALILLIGATLLIRTLASLGRVNPGFRTDHLLTARLFLAGPGYTPEERRASFFERLLDRARALPGVRETAWTNLLPLGEGVWASYSVGIEGSATPNPYTSDKFALNLKVSPDYFRAMGIPVISGRAFDARDRAGAPRVVIVNRTMARRYWPDGNPIGKRITKVDPPQWMTVVGVVGDVRDWGPSEEPAPAMFIPALQEPPKSAYLVLRTSGTVSAASLAEAVHAVDRAEPVASVLSGEDLMARANASPRFRALVLSVFAGLALLLAIVGVYGIISYSVSQRTHEIGIRMALGARREDALKLVVGQGLALAALGVALGLAGAFALTRFLADMLYGVRPTDLLTFFIVSLVLTAVALLASYVPARRATKVDPMIALRYE
jgi:putative ABC transport system permease protein